jgi:molecular chaperone DnaK (HSP70)
MKLGIDFGTNRIVVAAADRGNYPLVCFEAPDGTTPDWFPSLAALRGEERRYGWEAWDRQGEEGWTVVRSVKRLLEDAGPLTSLDLGDQQVNVTSLLDGLASALHKALHETSNLRLGSNRNLEAVLGVPANANNNQRFLTVEAFRKAGFQVGGVLNEPSAASIEFGHRERDNKRGRQNMLVYDLGGGTFDASLVTLDGDVHHVIGSEGISAIGGDDFDQILADLALEYAGIDSVQRDSIPAGAWFRLLEECRTKKEALNPNSRRISIDLEQANPAWPTVQIPVSEFYEAARPLVEETLAAAEDLLERYGGGQSEVLYVTGGGSELPLVARVLRERFGRRVRRSAYTRSATAIGLAIQADQPDTYRLTDRLSRYFGVWREGEHGSRITFDPLFEKDTPLPSPGEPALAIHRSYRPVHNLGHFRFLECSHRAENGAPSGEIALWDEIRFPFEPSLQDNADFSQMPVGRFPGAGQQQIEERYECDSGGAITVTISNLSACYSRTYRLGRWSPDRKSVKPAKFKKQSAGA